MKPSSVALLACLVLLTPGILLAQSHSGTITMAFDMSAHPDTSTTRLWVPYPVSDENQMITDITMHGDYNESAVYTDRKYQTPILYARWDKGAHSRKLTFSRSRSEAEFTHGICPECVEKLYPDFVVIKKSLRNKMKAFRRIIGASPHMGPLRGERGEGRILILVPDRGGGEI